MRYLMVILAALVMLTQQALPAPDKEIIRVSQSPVPISYETAWQMGLAQAPMFFNLGQTISGDPVLLYYNNLQFLEDSGPTTPATNRWALYAKTDGLYYKDDAGVETGPLAAAGVGSGDVTSGSNITDHALVRGDGGTKGIQDADQWIIGDNGDIVGTLAGATDHAMSTKVTADAAERWVVRADGAQLFSDGTGAADTAFQRSQANTFALGTGDAFRLVGSAGDHAGPLNGMIHYDTTSNRFDFRENGAWVSYGTGTVGGSGTNNHIPRFDGTDDIQDSDWIIDDTTSRMRFDDSNTAIRLIADGGYMELEGPSGGAGKVLDGFVYGDTDPKVRLSHDGLSFGPGGSTGPDNQLTRLSATQMSFSEGLVINEDSADADTRIESDDDANMIYVDANNNRVGLRTASPTRVFHIVSTTEGSIPAPVMTTAQQATRFGPQEGEQIYNSDRDTMLQYDGQRDRNMTVAGWAPFAYPAGFDSTAAYTTAVSLAANGGSIAFPVVVTGHMLVESVSIRNTDTGTARSWRWAIYEQYLNNGNSGENTLTRVVTTSGSDAFTPGGAASTRTLAASTDTYLGPGTYWLVVQNSHATNTFGFGTAATSATFSGNMYQTKTVTNPPPSTLDFVAATWTKGTNIPGARLNCVVFGTAAAF